MHLANMPRVVMSHILESAGFRAILSLQKISRDLRNFVEDVRPEYHLKSISITVTFNCISIYMDPYMDWSVDIMYQEQNEGCSVQNFPKQEVFIKDQDFTTTFLNDLETNLKNQKAILELLRLSFECVLEGFLNGFEKVLKSREIPLRVGELNLEVSNQEEVMTILPYIDPKSIKKLSISSPQGLIDLETNLVTKLDQWRGVKDLEMFNCVVSEPLKNFAHFSNAKVCVQMVFSGDLLELKERFLASKNFKKFIMTYKIFEEDIYLPDLFGEPLVIGRDTWSFPYPESDESLLLVHLDNCTFNFSRVKSSEIVFKRCHTPIAA